MIPEFYGSRRTSGLTWGQAKLSQPGCFGLKNSASKVPLQLSATCDTCCYIPCFAFGRDCVNVMVGQLRLWEEFLVACSCQIVALPLHCPHSHHQPAYSYIHQILSFVSIHWNRHDMASYSHELRFSQWKNDNFAHLAPQYPKHTMSSQGTSSLNILTGNLEPGTWNLEKIQYNIKFRLKKWNLV